MLRVMRFVGGSPSVAFGLLTLSLVACVTTVDSEPPKSRGGAGKAGADASTGGRGGAVATGGVSGSGPVEKTGGAGGTNGTGGSKPEIPPCPSSESVCLDAVATWFGNAKGAYTIVHDDLCSYESHYVAAYNELSTVGLRAAFGAIAGSCSESWDKINKLKSAGHEIINHSYSHTDLGLNADSHDKEIVDSTKLINEKLTEQETLFFIFPYDSH